MPHLLTVSGSLRTGSSNAALLAAAAQLAPAGVTVSVYSELGVIPAFSPDLEQAPAPVPPAVAHWRAALAAADMILISSPEYAHGVPGALKNALDWVVGSVQCEIVNKPVVLLNASPRATYAQTQLVEVLTPMSAVVGPEATILLDIPRRGVDAVRLAADPVLAPALGAAVAALVAAGR